MSVTFFQIKKILESNKKIPYHIVKYLITTDFLLNNITQILPEYTEPPIYFEPTYKRDSLTGNFKLKKKTNTDYVLLVDSRVILIEL